MVSVSYTCPHCGAVIDVERPPEIADRSVTLTAQPGWEYATLDDPPEAREAADGIVFECGERERTEGCGRPFYLNFVRFESGVELEPDPAEFGGPRFDFRP
ncbi:hypothetical protein [Saliphagus sp. LR7]|uniref:hypothetical protein n=1 Tax=Saliphagus sp. LR7 TaxID=2282654 RepID=UPI000DF7E36B|nr:hypothetical protein [Saliphagus sp. LR7]